MIVSLSDVGIEVSVYKSPLKRLIPFDINLSYLQYVYSLLVNMSKFQNRFDALDVEPDTTNVNTTAVQAKDKKPAAPKKQTSDKP